MSLSLYVASLNVFYTAYSQSDFFGKLIFLGLFFLSAVCWIVLGQKIWQVKKVREVSAAFHQAFEKNKDRLLNLEIDELPKSKHKEVPHPFAKIFDALKNKTVEILNKNLFFANQSGKGK